MRTRITVNRHNIAHNKKNPTDPRPVLSSQTYKGITYGNEIVFHGEDGKPSGRLVYRPEKPMSCGATVFFETNNKVEVVA